MAGGPDKRHSSSPRAHCDDRCRMTTKFDPPPTLAPLSPAWQHVDAGPQGIVSKLAVHDALIHSITRPLPHHAWEIWAFTDSHLAESPHNKWNELPYSGTVLFLLKDLLLFWSLSFFLFCLLQRTSTFSPSGTTTMLRLLPGPWPDGRPELRSLLGPFYFGKLRQHNSRRSI